MADVETGLLVKLEARLTAFEKSMAAAERRGTKTYNDLKSGSRSATRQMEADMTRAAARVGEALSTVDRRIGAVGAAASRSNVVNFRYALQQLGLQAQDMAVQVAGGTSALRAFSQQAPQLLSGFGAVGIAIGAAAAALPLLTTAFGDSEAEADAFAETAKGLEAALTSLKQSGFEVTEATSLFGAALRQISETTTTASIDALREQLRSLTDDVVLLQSETDQFFEPGGPTISGVDVLAEKLGLGEEQAQRLHEALVAVASAPMDQLAGAAQDALNIISNITKETGGELSPAMQAVADSVQAAGVAASTLAGNTASATSAAQGLASSWQQVLANAQGAMMASGRAMAAAERARQAQQAVNSSRPTSFGGALEASPGDFPVSGTIQTGIDILNDQFPTYGGGGFSSSSPASGGGGGHRGGGGGGGGGGGSRSEADERALEEQRQVQLAVRDAVRDTAQAQRELQRENERTAATFADVFVDAITGARSLGDSLGALAIQFAKLAAQRGFEQLLNAGTGGVGGGATGGGIFGGAIIPGILHDGGIAGSDGYGHGRSFSPALFAGAPRYHSGGVAGLRPNEVPAILEKGERVLPAGSANGGTGGSQLVNVAVDVGVTVDDDGKMQAYVKDVSSQVAASTFKAGISDFGKKHLPELARRAIRDRRTIG